ncbi:hypothetical protein [Microcoleus sp. FACHB-672]|uniref:slr1601 family putative cell division protein n=1 Tax=Microcoleus sp. FACHB-672 TaxID=2692825 RepID=UPI001686EBF9|nr:hypothetical protein [Microcoleus sp. FACHB-672]MBD2042306.1 hypothetical protein [Microcoleus sp. FACHB-672]
MNAIQPSRPTLQPVEPRRRVARRAGKYPRQNPHLMMATETTVKLAVNVVLSLVAVSALVQLLPHNRAGQEKLQQVQTEVQSAQGRVNQLRADFSRSFGPQQVKTIMQEQSYRMDPTQLRIVWLENRPSEAQELAEPLQDLDTP